MEWEEAGWIGWDEKKGKSKSKEMLREGVSERGKERGFAKYIG